jgi:phosphate transport system substrate-binding protein
MQKADNRLHLSTFAKRVARLLVTLTTALAIPELVARAQAQPAELDQGLPAYQRIASVSGGRIQSVGSETMNNMMTAWLTEFQSMYPNVNPEVNPRGSSNAFPALIAGQANLGQMSREPKKSEIADFRARYGYAPLVIPTAIDMVVVWVHEDNPIERITFEELDAIFSSTRLRGARGRAEQWKEFVEDDPLSKRAVLCFGRNAASGTYGYFKQTVLNQGDYGPWVNELSGSSFVAQSIAENPGGIGYSGIGFQTAGVKPLALAVDRAGPYYKPESRHAYSRRYPLSRFLYIILNQDPRQPMDSARRELLKYIFSKQGQRQVVRDGFVPLKADFAKQILRSLGINSPGQ